MNKAVRFSGEFSNCVASVSIVSRRPSAFLMARDSVGNKSAEAPEPISMLMFFDLLPVD